MPACPLTCLPDPHQHTLPGQRSPVGHEGGSSGGGVGRVGAMGVACIRTAGGPRRRSCLPHSSPACLPASGAHLRLAGCYSCDNVLCNLHWRGGAASIGSMEVGCSVVPPQRGAARLGTVCPRRSSCCHCWCCWCCWCCCLCCCSRAIWGQCCCSGGGPLGS